MFEVPFESLSESRNRIQQLRLERFHGKKRNQPDHGANLERNCLTTRQVQNVIIKTIGFIPQPDPLPDGGHGLRNLQEVLEEFRRDLLVHVVVNRQFQSDSHQIQAVHRHPTGAVRLVDVSAHGQRSAPIEHPDVIEAEEPALKDIPPGGVLPIDPPGEIQHQLVKNTFQESEITRIVRDFGHADVCDRFERPARLPTRGPAG